jgi:hypothetical protein
MLVQRNHPVIRLARKSRQTPKTAISHVMQRSEAIVFPDCESHQSRQHDNLYEIRARDIVWGIVDPDWGDRQLDASKSRLVDVLEDVGAKTLKYLYDFGDGWEHTVKIERITDAIPGLPYPVLLEATGRCPPEDVGGPWGYSDLLNALADPNHERHVELSEWISGSFDPLACNAGDLAEAVDALARKWSRRPNAKPGKFH